MKVGDSISFFRMDFPRVGFVSGIKKDGDYVVVFRVENEKPIEERVMDQLRYKKDNFVQSSPLRGEVQSVRTLLTEKTLWSFKYNEDF